MKALLVVEPPLHDQLHALISGAGIHRHIGRSGPRRGPSTNGKIPRYWSSSSSNDDSAALELCRQVRSQTGGEPKLIWIVTSRADPEQFQAIRAAAVDGCLLLPLNLVDVELRLATARRRLEELDRLLRTEDALRKSIERFDLAASTAPAKDCGMRSPPAGNGFLLKRRFGFRRDSSRSWAFKTPSFPTCWKAGGNAFIRTTGRAFTRRLVAHVEHRAPYEVEYRMFTKPGEIRWIAAKGQGNWNAEGTLVRMAGSIRDITESRRVADALQVSEEKWRSLVEHAPMRSSWLIPTARSGF